MFWLKKIIAPFFYPLPLVVLLLGIGLGLLWFTRKQRWGRILTTAGFLLLLGFSLYPGPWLLVRPLERAHPDGLLTFMQKNPTALPKYIVVLGGGHVSDPNLPLTSQISPGSLVRLTEGIRLLRKIPEARLVLSGGRITDPVPNAVVMARIAESLGVRAADIILEPRPLDTHDEARFLAPLLGTEPFVLITSAGHMPRALALFRKAGTDPIPMATHHYLKTSPGPPSPRNFLLPQEGNIEACRAAIHEYLGLFWSRLRGQT
jgi:uncharacterized SAM-binding protein YcdF (DUF218 family)